ncbi:MAG: hypothetical protein E7345_00810 [Clostridiales bacterium]|nr:hypothetical protein [Clostridiales bacterium]
MKKLIENTPNPWCQEEYKKIIDELILNKDIQKLKLQENYFDICNNYWIIDRYIARSGQISQDSTPNTLSAYEQCIKNKYTILLPIQILDDDTLICFSHKNISKVISSASGYVNNMSLEQIKDINLNDKKEKILTLDEALDFINNKTSIIIEINNDGMIGKLEDKVLQSLQKYIAKHKAVNNIAIMGINPYTLQYFFEQCPYITRILKSGGFSEKMYGSIPTKKLRNLSYYKITNADFIAYSLELLPCIKVENKKPVGVLAYTVTNQSQYIQIAPHCDNIIFSYFKPTI